MATKFWASSVAGNFTTAGNWSDAAAPASGDILYFSHLATGDVTSGLATGIGSGAGAESLTLFIEKGYTGSIGTVGSGAATYLSFAATLETLTAHIGVGNYQGTPSGSGRIFIDASNVTTANFYVYDSAATSGETYYPPILIKGGGSTTLNLYVMGGSVGVAARPGETTTLTLAQLMPTTGAAPTVTPNLLIGAGVTVTSLSASVGTILNRSNNTTSTLNLSGTADYQHTGSGAHTTANVVDDAVFTYRGTGTGTQITTLNLGGTFRRRSGQSITIGEVDFYEGAILDLDNGTASASTAVTTKVMVGCAQDDVTIRTPRGVYL